MTPEFNGVDLLALVAAGAYLITAYVRGWI